MRTQMRLQALPALDDNYIWVLHNAHQAIVVDPGQSAPVLNQLSQYELELSGILITHRHHDHVDGVAALLAAHPCTVYAPAMEPLPAALRGLALHTVQGGDSLNLLDQTIQVLHTPGHLPEHVSYFLPHVSPLQLDTPLMQHTHWKRPSTPTDAATPLLFCGDTLFSAGCGRVMDGRIESYAALYASLQRIAQLPAHTLICGAHEYTSANLRFAMDADPCNTVLHIHKDAVVKQRKLGLSSLPSTLALEQSINPFLRCHHRAVQQQVAHSMDTKRFHDTLSPLVTRNLAVSLNVNGTPLMNDFALQNPLQTLDLTTFIQLRQWKNQF